MSNDKMREMFESEIPIPNGHKYQSATNSYEISEGLESAYCGRGSYNHSWLRFQQGWQAALSQQPEIEPNRIQRSKLEFLTSRDDYVAHRDESVIRVSFAGYEHCYLDRFGRVLWLNDPSELVRPQPSAQVPEGYKNLYEKANRLIAQVGFAGEIDSRANEVSQLLSALEEIDENGLCPCPAAPSIAESSECLCADPDAPVDHSDFGSRFCPGPTKCTKRLSIAEKRDATLLAAPFARLNDQQQEEARRRFADARPGDGYLYCDHTDYARGAPGVVWVRRPEPPEPQP